MEAWVQAASDTDIQICCTIVFLQSYGLIENLHP